MVGVIDGFRWAILGGSAELFWPGIAMSLILTIVLFAAAIAYFRKTERAFADII
jgi:lipopolysaccharide transport system permease protein